METPSRYCEFRFYEELNDFLPPERRKQSFIHCFTGTPSVKDQIQALGVPHTEVDLILVNGASVSFGHRLRGGERVAVYPMFERFDIGGLTRLRARPLRAPRFVLDVHLGKLARYLRFLGFDTRYRNDYHDVEIVRIARAERRIVLTRDLGILKHNAVTHGAFLHATNPRQQLAEVLTRFDLWRQVRMFSRCSHCNGLIVRTRRTELAEHLPGAILERYRAFYRCADCGQVYWEGSHYDRMNQWVQELRAARSAAASGD
ncbi:MAG TPA: Mut7-C RNAse domain-containing protein [Candidatus Competibacteraceae bacterium]|nr:Mut7-C RNAse domain-containing protein [Candidatus Competibacteraceae bacterium]